MNSTIVPAISTKLNHFSTNHSGTSTILDYTSTKPGPISTILKLDSTIPYLNSTNPSTNSTIPSANSTTQKKTAGPSPTVISRDCYSHSEQICQHSGICRFRLIDAVRQANAII